MTVLVSDGSVESSATVGINVVLINEYCPVITAQAETLMFTEGSVPTYPLGMEAVIAISDSDRTPHDLIESLEVSLSGERDGGLENISITVAEGFSIRAIPHPDSGTVTTVTITGQGSPLEYTSMLSTLEYANHADEPSLGTRSVAISLSQRGVSSCQSLHLRLEVVPINDNAPVLSVSSNEVTFTEGSGPLAIFNISGLTLTDRDHNSVFFILGANITSTGAQSGEVFEVPETPSLNVNIDGLSKDAYTSFYLSHSTCTAVVTHRSMYTK